MNHNASLLGKNLSMLFWLIIPNVIAGIFTSSGAKALVIIGQILSLLCLAAYGYLLYQLAAESVNYRMAGTFYFVLAAITLLTLLLGWVPVVGLLLNLATLVVALLATEREFKAHGEVAAGYDAALAGKWRSLWKLYIISFCVSILSVLLLLLLPRFASVLLVVSSVLLVVISILKLIYLYREAKLFRQMAGEAV